MVSFVSSTLRCLHLNVVVADAEPFVHDLLDVLFMYLEAVLYG